MTHPTRHHLRRPLAVVGLVLIGLAATAAIPQAPAPTPVRSLLGRMGIPTHCPLGAGIDARASTSAERMRSAYFAELTGNGAEGRDMVWRGAVAGAAVGDLTVRLAHLGRDLDTATPTWPVEGIVVVSSDDPQRSFAAEVHGTIDWAAKRVTLTGEVSVGYMRGARVEQTADLVDNDLSGELRFVPATLAVR